MARTKQTARKCLIQKVPRIMLQSQKAARKTGPLKIKKSGKGGKNVKIGGSNRPPSQSSDSEAEIESHEVNNQQFSVKFDDQAKCQQQAITGQIISCTNCAAILTLSSKVYSHKDYEKLSIDPSLSDEKKQQFLKNYQSAWICEFCLTHNAIPDSYKVPQIQNPCFLIEKAKQKRQTRGKQTKVEQTNKILIFCIDISGSMEMEVYKKKSRLDTVKEALLDEINRMNFQKQVIQVGLVTFGSFVTLIGDGKDFQQRKLDSEIYFDFQAIVKQASKVNKFTTLISSSYKSLKERIQNLGVYGSTALGPGLLASIQIASKGGIGSKVIICTDGQANVGLGSMISYGNKGDGMFYEKAAQFAKKKRVQVSILSLKGDKCNLKELGKLSLATGGSILKIQPSALGTEFSKIAKQEILGSDSQLLIKVNKVFEIISHVPNELSADKTTLTQQFGNFTSQTELAFQFKVLTKQQAALKPGVDLDLFHQPQLPMQVQLTYIGRNGNKYKQVINDWRVPTENQKEIYEGANFGLFAASVLQRASSKIKSQQFSQAQKVIKGYWSLVSQSFSKTQNEEELKKFGDRIKKLETVLNSKLKKSGDKSEKRERSRSKQRKRNDSRKKKIEKKVKSKQKSRGRGRQSMRVQQSQSEDDRSVSSNSERGMSSDEEEEILWKQMRARSRSNSPEEKSKSKKKMK